MILIKKVLLTINLKGPERAKIALKFSFDSEEEKKRLYRIAVLLLDEKYLHAVVLAPRTGDKILDLYKQIANEMKVKTEDLI